jgi:hypothetical protein
VERLEADVAALAAMERGSAGPGERASADWILGRLRGMGIEGKVEAYRGRRTYAWSFGVLALAGLLPLPARLAALVALELDASGRAPLPLATGEGANVVARVPAAEERRATLVLMAHHDTQRAGLVWAPALHRPGAARRLRTRSIPPYLALSALVVGLGLRRASLAIAALSAEQALRSPVPGANDNATGVAAVLALLERWSARPFDHLEVVAVFPGSEESGMAGARAFFATHAFDPATTLVLNLDTLGSGTPIVLEAEHALLRHRYAARDLALVPADVERWTIGGWTDALQAKLAGLRALSLLSIGPEGTFTHYHHPSDTPEHVDFASVRACVEVAQRVAEAFAQG